MLNENAETSQVVMVATQGKFADENAEDEGVKTPKMDKDTALRAFEKSKDLTIKAMKKSSELSHGELGPQEALVEMWVDQAKVEDELFLSEGVNNDDLEEAMMYYMG